MHIGYVGISFVSTPAQVFFFKVSCRERALQMPPPGQWLAPINSHSALSMKFFILLRDNLLIFSSGELFKNLCLLQVLRIFSDAFF